MTSFSVEVEEVENEVSMKGTGDLITQLWHTLTLAASETPSGRGR